MADEVTIKFTNAKLEFGFILTFVKADLFNKRESWAVITAKKGGA